MSISNYGFTIKNIQHDYKNEKSDLLSVAMDMINKFKGELVDYAFECDSILRIHIHGIFKARKGIKYSLFKKKFYHIHIDTLHSQQDLSLWKNYIRKTEYYAAIQNYAFIEEVDILDHAVKMGEHLNRETEY